jgi:hypothetical protein
LEGASKRPHVWTAPGCSWRTERASLEGPFIWAVLAWAKRTSLGNRLLAIGGSGGWKEWRGSGATTATGHASLASRSDTPARLLGKKWETDSL